MSRLALKVAYDGSAFFGSQRQPGLRTVEQEVIRALQYVKAIAGPDEARFGFAGRTDRGVHAAGNVFAVDTAFPREKVLSALAGAMEDVWAWAVARVPDDFEPRHARSRTYEYLLPNTVLDVKVLDETLQRFVGRHDFSGFARLDEDRNPERTIHAIVLDVQGPFLVVRVTGDSFLWHMVRRIVEASRRVAVGEVPPEVVREALSGGATPDLGLAPAENLVLVDVEHDGVAWETTERARAGVLDVLMQRVLRAEFASLFAARVADLARAVPAGPEPVLRNR